MTSLPAISTTALTPTSCPNEVWKIAVSAFSGFFGAMLIAVLVWLFYYKPQRWREKGADAEKSGKKDLQKDYDALKTTHENMLRYGYRP